MVEEAICIEEELYELCNDAVNLGEKIIESIDEVDSEKISFICKKLVKIARIINNCELASELLVDKETIKNKLRKVIELENSILDEKPDNIQELESSISAIIEEIKTIETVLILFYDPTLYLSKEGISDGIKAYRRGINKIDRYINQMGENYANRFETLEAEQNNKMQQFDNKREEIETNIADQTNLFLDKIAELEKRLEEKRLETEKIKEEYENSINDLKESFTNKISEFEKNATQDFDNIKSKIEEKDKKISELISLVGSKANIGEYKTNADKSHTERIIWQVATIVILALACGLMFYISTRSSGYNLATLVRYIISIILLGMSGYTGKQASNLRKDEVYYRKQQLELSSIDVYLDNIPEDTRIQIKQELSNRIFGQASETYKNKNDDNIDEFLNNLTKLIGNLYTTLPRK